jgi:probable H4MPT-linked C1 transfer pathway protein
MNTQSTTGWDIGGANIKAARFGPDSLRVVQQPFAIWQRRDDLADVLRALADQLGPASSAGITMTAELSDAFRTKREGVHFVLDAVEQALSGVDLQIFGVDGRFHSIATARDQPLLVAASNWMATACVVARSIPDCLLVDIGSTTTDIIPIEAGKVIAGGANDPQRLLRGELLYTGALRTPAHAIVQRVPLWGGWCPVAAEYFATTQDVYLVLGELAPEHCASPTADGRPATPQYAAERLARVVCADADMLREAEILAIARFVADAQTRQIIDALAQVRSTHLIKGPVVAAGVGAFLVERAAARLGLSCERLADQLGTDASIAAPAAALAVLLARPDA